MHSANASYRDVHEVNFGYWNGGVPYFIVAEQENACDPARPEGNPPTHPGVGCRIAMFQWLDGTLRETILARASTHNQAVTSWNDGLLMADANHGAYGASKDVHVRFTHRKHCRVTGAMKIVIINQPQDAVVADAEQRGSVASSIGSSRAGWPDLIRSSVFAPGVPGQVRLESWQGIGIRRIPGVAKRFHKGVQLLVGRLIPHAQYFNSRLYFREYYSRLIRELRRQSPDVVHLPQQLQFVPLLRRALPKAKIVVHMHQDELASLDYAPVAEQLGVLDAVVTVSDYVTRRARARFPQFASKIHTIGNGVDLSRFQPGNARPAAAVVKLLFVGRISPDKGVHLLIDAFNALVREHPGCRTDGRRQTWHAAFRHSTPVAERRRGAGESAGILWPVAFRLVEARSRRPKDELCRYFARATVAPGRAQDSLPELDVDGGVGSHLPGRGSPHIALDMAGILRLAHCRGDGLRDRGAGEPLRRNTGTRGGWRHGCVGTRNQTSSPSPMR